MFVASDLKRLHLENMMVFLENKDNYATKLTYEENRR